MTQLPDIAALQDQFTAKWHDSAETPAGSGLEDLILSQHRQNFDLWHEEDRARSPLASSDQIAQTKRSIDHLNQERNDLIEAIDRELLHRLHTDSIELRGPLHSETPGMIIDRLSILSLKIFHTREEMERQDAPPEHVRKNRERMNILLEQRRELSACLKELWQEVCAGRRQFKLYRQLKMYNDPELNPEIYRVQR